ncbi:MAG: hypothetical protein GY794_09320 [bacterium]|nr:hypothetical protein [bacterium]
MRTKLFAFVAVFALLHIPAYVIAEKNDPVSGQWIGTYTVPELEIAQERYRIHLVLKDTYVKGTIGTGPDGFKLKNGNYDPYSGELTAEGETRGQGRKEGEIFDITMEAVINGDTLTGTFIVGEMEGTFKGQRQ